MNLTNTPTKIDTTIMDFCKTIVPIPKVEYIDVCPEKWCKENDCYENVAKKVKSSGGKRQLGWRIQVVPDPMPKYLIEAVHHAIWVMDDGRKIDITPQPESASSIVFLEDNQTQLGKYRIGERYQALMKEQCVIEYVRLCNLESKEYVSKTMLNSQPNIPKELLFQQNMYLMMIAQTCK